MHDCHSSILEGSLFFFRGPFLHSLNHFLLRTSKFPLTLLSLQYKVFVRVVGSVWVPAYVRVHHDDAAAFYQLQDEIRGASTMENDDLQGSNVDFVRA